MMGGMLVSLSPTPGLLDLVRIAGAGGETGAPPFAGLLATAAPAADPIAAPGKLPPRGQPLPGTSPPLPPVDIDGRVEVMPAAPSIDAVPGPTSMPSIEAAEPPATTILTPVAPPPRFAVPGSAMVARSAATVAVKPPGDDEEPAPAGGDPVATADPAASGGPTSVAAVPVASIPPVPEPPPIKPRPRASVVPPARMPASAGAEAKPVKRAQAEIAAAPVVARDTPLSDTSPPSGPTLGPDARRPRDARPAAGASARGDAPSISPAPDDSPAVAVARRPVLIDAEPRLSRDPGVMPDRPTMPPRPTPAGDANAVAAPVPAGLAPITVPRRAPSALAGEPAIGSSIAAPAPIAPVQAATAPVPDHPAAAPVAPVIALASAPRPFIQPAMHAFGAAIRQALAEERKPARVAADPLAGPGAAAIAVPAPSLAPVNGFDTPVDLADRRWPHAMARHIERLREEADETSTRIRLLPDALGPVDVAVRRDGDTVHVRFTAASAETRQLLADAQPRLADAADARGFKLGRADVGGGELAQRDDRQPAGRRPAPLPTRPVPARASAPAADDLDARLA